jgi:hypothetical protein
MAYSNKAQKLLVRQRIQSTQSCPWAVSSAQITLLSYTAQIPWSGSAYGSQQLQQLNFTDTNIPGKLDVVGVLDSTSDASKGALALLLVHTQSECVSNVVAGLIIRSAWSTLCSMKGLDVSGATNPELL